MNLKIFSILACPKCKFSLGLQISNKSRNRIHNGKLICEKCNSVFEIKDDIICFKSITLSDKKKANIRKDKQYLKIRQKHEKEWLNYLTKQEFLAIKDEWKWIINNICLSRNKLHLDWATGNGKLLRNILKVTKSEIIGIEIDYAKCIELKNYLISIDKYSKVTIICCDARIMPFLNNSFESISSWNGLVEVSNPNKVVDECERILKPGGLLVATGEFCEEGSRSLEIAKKIKLGIFARENKACQYFKKIGLKNISYRIFFKAKEFRRHTCILPQLNDYYAFYGIRGRKK